MVSRKPRASAPSKPSDPPPSKPAKRTKAAASKRPAKSTKAAAPKKPAKRAKAAASTKAAGRTIAEALSATEDAARAGDRALRRALRARSGGRHQARIQPSSLQASGGDLAPYRILSLDGGPATPSYLRYLRALEVSQPGFLDSVDMFAGASDGAWAALFFASRPPDTDPLDMIDAAIAFNEGTVDAIQPGLVGLLRLASGFWSATDNTAALDYLTSQYGDGPEGKPITLGELQRDVVIVSFRVRSRTAKPGARFYHNLARNLVQGGEAGWTFNDVAYANLGMSAAEVALRSGSFPVMMPIRDGFVDGGLFANNPAVCAIAQLLEFRESRGVTGLDDIVMLSCGADQAMTGSASANQRFFSEKDVSWGWAQWLATPWSPMLLMDTVISAGGKGIAYQAHQLLGERFLRLAPPLPIGMSEEMLRLLTGFTAKLFELADEQAASWSGGQLGLDYRPNFYRTSQWLEQQWFCNEAPVRVTNEGGVERVAS